MKYGITKSAAYISLTLGFAMFVSGCFREEWEGFVYPNRNNLGEHVYIGTYKTLEECRASAIDALTRISSVSAGDYECGLNCKTKNGMGSIKVCEKTER